MSYPKYINRYHRVDLFKRKENVQFSTIFGGGWLLKSMVIFELFSISKKLKSFSIFE